MFQIVSVRYDACFSTFKLFPGGILPLNIASPSISCPVARRIDYRSMNPRTRLIAGQMYWLLGTALIPKGLYRRDSVTSKTMLK
jgi:hypothetical protein